MPGPVRFLSILGSCYTTLDAKLFEDAATLLPGFICLADVDFFYYSTLNRGINM